MKTKSNNMMLFITLIMMLLVIVIIVHSSTEKFKPQQQLMSQPEFKAQLNAEETDPLFQSNQLIGLMYPPRCGPLHTNYEFPNKEGGMVTPFVAIYEQEPYLRYFGKSC